MQVFLLALAYSLDCLEVATWVNLLLAEQKRKIEDLEQRMKTLKDALANTSFTSGGTMAQDTVRLQLMGTASYAPSPPCAGRTSPVSL